MKKVTPEEDKLIFWKFMDECKEEFFKIEVLQYYKEEGQDGESLKAWLAGDREKAIEIETLMPYWVEGREDLKKIRVHVVEYPLNEYLKWEIEAYKIVNIAKGKEEVFLLDKAKVKDVWLPKGDSFIFDKKRAISNKYGEKGRFLGAEIYEEPNEVKKFLDLREKLLGADLERVQA